jgi:ketosteroid isomerase-like protein
VTDSANVELVRSIFAAHERGDFTSTEWAHPKIEWTIADGPTAGSWTGMAGMEQSFRGMLSAWTDLRIAAEEYRELDDERVLVLVLLSGRGKTSGVDLSRMPTHGAQMFQVRDSTVTRIVTYYDRERALADLGLPPEGDAS